MVAMAIFMLAPGLGWGQISITSGSLSYTQNFDGLAATNGTGIAWTNNTTPLAGWYLYNSTPSAITTYSAETGSTGNFTYCSYGLATGNTERALGSMASGGAYWGSPGSGVVAGYMAVAFTNSTGGTVNSVTISFDGEQWRNGGNATAQTMTMQYGFGATFATVGSWTTAASTFNFTSPVTGASAAVVNGNVAGKVSGLGGTIASLSWTNTSILWLRWIETNDAGNDHALAIDNFSFTATGAGTPPTVTTSAVSSIGTATATGNGAITNIGSSAVTVSGVCWNTLANPTTANFKTIDGPTAVGTITSSMSGLAVNTYYYVKAYATNSTGPGYGSEVNFWTLANVPGAPTVGSATTTSLNVTLNANGNPASTEFAIQETGGQYVQASGALGASAVWQTAAIWSTKTVAGLSSGTTYTFQVKARNGATTETTFGATGSSATTPLAPTAAAANTIGSNGFTANWGAVTGASSYKIDVATSSAFSGTIISENFAGFITNIGSADRSGTLNTYLQTPGWTGVAIYEMIGYAKLGASSTKGLITTPTIDLSSNGGNSTLTFDVGQYGTDVGLIQVYHAADGSTFIQVGSDITPPASLTPQTVQITGGTVNSKIRISAKNASSNRFYLDNIGVAYSSILNSYNNLTTVNPISQPVTGLTPNTTYYYRVRAVGGNSTSANSVTITVLTAPAAPVATAATSVLSTGFAANWDASAGATGYKLDVAADIAFSNLLSGYNNLDVSNVTTYDVSGLTGNTPYYYRVRAYNTSATGDNSNTITANTSAAATSTFTGTGNWEDAARWSSGLPGAITNVTISGTATITSLVECNNCTISSMGALTINAVTGLIVDGNFLIQSGGSFISDAADLVVTGTTTVERDIAANQWHLISSPVAGATAEMFTDKYMQTHLEGLNSYTDVTDINTALTPCKGFALWGDAAGFTAQYVGPLNTGAQSYSTTYEYSGIDPANNGGWNLVGNPYPSAIDFTLLTRNNVNNAFYVHISNSSWGVYAGSVVSPNVSVTQYIASGQGFFVQASAAGSLSMTNIARVQNNIAFYKKSDIVNNLIRLTVSGNGYTDEAVVRFVPEATDAFDGEYDAHKLYGDVAEAAQLYTGSTPLAINALPETDAVQVGVHARTSGVYTIAAIEINDLQYVTLEDTKTGAFTDLVKNSYSFSFVPGENEQRFILHFSALGVNDLENSFANIYSNSRIVYVDLKDNVKGDIFIYNISGQLVASVPAAQGKSKISLVNTGNYIVKVITDQSTMVKKVFVQ